MKIYLIWQESDDGRSHEVIGFCKSDEQAWAMVDKLKAAQNSKRIRWNYWVEELEELQ